MGNGEEKLFFKQAEKGNSLNIIAGQSYIYQQAMSRHDINKKGKMKQEAGSITLSRFQLRAEVGAGGFCQFSGGSSKFLCSIRRKTKRSLIFCSLLPCGTSSFRTGVKTYTETTRVTPWTLKQETQLLFQPEPHLFPPVEPSAGASDYLGPDGRLPAGKSSVKLLETQRLRSGFCRSSYRTGLESL